jgi:hypothetical protein
MIPLSDANGELQYAAVSTLIKSGETLTHLDAVEISGGSIIIKYTAEDGRQQVVSTKLATGQQDINVADAKLDNPSAGVYRLIITETDGNTYPVDLSALLAVVTANTADITLSGNGTPGDPLRADLTSDFLQKVPHTLDELQDCTVTQAAIDEQSGKYGNVYLGWDSSLGQWVPEGIAGPDRQAELTEWFNGLKGGDRVYLQYPTDQLVQQSIKVYRNGLRQYLNEDYRQDAQGTERNAIVFTEPFTDRYAEKVIVDYCPLVAALPLPHG